MIEPLPYSFSIVATASSIALPLFLASSMSQRYTAYLFSVQAPFLAVVRVATLAAATLATLTTLTTLGTFTLAACVAGCERNGPPTRGSAESSSRTDAADAAPRSPAAVAALERALALDAGALGNLGALGHGADLADPAALAG